MIVLGTGHRGATHANRNQQLWSSQPQGQCCTQGMYAPGEGEEWRGMAKPLQVHPGQEQMDREGNFGRRLSGLPETDTLLPSPSLDQAFPCSSAFPTYGEEECSPISALPRLRC